MSSDGAALVSQPPDPQASANQIRGRLLRLLGSALGLTLVTVAAIVVLIVLLVGLLFREGLPPFPNHISRLHDYYTAHGSWDGAQAVFDDRFANWVLVGVDGLVYARGSNYHGPLDEPLQRTDNLEMRVPLHSNGQLIGDLVTFVGIDSFNDFIVDLIRQVGLIFFLLFLILAFFAGLVAYQLARRYVDPLADVIAAAQAVAGGRLSARAPVRGTGDLRALNDSFNHMADALERSDRERRDLLADVAHELRTPLSIVQGRLEGMVDGIYELTPDQIAPALEETYLLERLVEDLRTLTLAESGRLRFDTRPVQIVDVAARVVDVFQAQAAERDVALQLTAPAATPLVDVDPQRLEQIIGNLVDNGLRYTPGGGQVQLDVSVSATAVELSVADTGPGVSAEEVGRVFDRFWRGEKSRARSGGGAGLGLAIVRQLVEAQGGKARAVNRPSGGFEIVIAFPCSAASA